MACRQDLQQRNKEGVYNKLGMLADTYWCRRVQVTVYNSWYVFVSRTVSDGSDDAPQAAAPPQRSVVRSGDQRTICSRKKLLRHNECTCHVSMPTGTTGCNAYTHGIPSGVHNFVMVCMTLNDCTVLTSTTAASCCDSHMSIFSEGAKVRAYSVDQFSCTRFQSGSILPGLQPHWSLHLQPPSFGGKLHLSQVPAPVPAAERNAPLQSACMYYTCAANVLDTVVIAHCYAAPLAGGSKVFCTDIPRT